MQETAVCPLGVAVRQEWLAFVTYGRENEKKFVAARCTYCYHIKPAQLGEPKTLCYIVGTCVPSLRSAVSVFISIILLLFVLLTTQTTWFQASEAEDS